MQQSQPSNSSLYTRCHMDAETRTRWTSRSLWWTGLGRMIEMFQRHPGSLRWIESVCGSGTKHMVPSNPTVKDIFQRDERLDVAEVLVHPTLIFECSSFWRRREWKAESSPTCMNLTDKAIQIALGLGLEGFKASARWLTKWKCRHAVGMRCGTNSSQKVPADYAELIQHFRASITKFRKAKDITPSRIVNIDQTMCMFDMPGTRTNNVRGSKTIRIKTTRAEIKGFTVSRQQLQLERNFQLSLCSRNEREFLVKESDRKSTSLQMSVQVSTNGWMTAEQYHRWLVQVYRKEGDRRLLIINSYKPHKSEDSVRVADDVLIIPGGCTSIVQPMDKCINKPFKESMRGSWQTWMRQDWVLTKAGNLKQPTRQDAINWVSAAWDSIKQDTIIRSFLVCGILWMNQRTTWLAATFLMWTQTQSHQRKT